MFLMDRAQVEARDNGVEGYDLPPYAGMLDRPIWENVEPPTGAVYNDPIRPWPGTQPSLTASDAEPDITVQVYNRAIRNQIMARLTEGQSIKQVIALAKDELEGFTR
jgi:hypothetical protein